MLGSRKKVIKALLIFMMKCKIQKKNTDKVIDIVLLPVLKSKANELCLLVRKNKI